MILEFDMEMPDKPLSSTCDIVPENQKIVLDGGKSIPSSSENQKKMKRGDSEPLLRSFKESQGISSGDPIPTISEEPLVFDPKPLPFNHEEYQTYIPGIGDTFPYFRDVADFRLIYVIPKSLLLDETNDEGVMIQLDEEFQTGEEAEFFTRYFTLKCYPNGDCKENEGYISLLFEENTSKMFVQLSKLSITFALLDVDKNHRFPQSLTMDHNDILYLNPDNLTIGLSRYMRRDALLSSDAFCAEKLLVQCEVQFHMIDNVLQEVEPPFVREDSYDEKSVHHISIVVNAGHLLWTILSEKSPYFHKIVVRDRNTVISMFDEMEYKAFDVIVKCIVSGTDPSMHGLSMQKVFNLYEYSDYVLLAEFKEMSRDIIKERMTAKIACNVIAMADMHGDADLKKFAIQYAMEHWRKVTASKSWDILNKERPDLAKEVKECRLAENEPQIKRRKKVLETETEYVEQFQYYQ